VTRRSFVSAVAFNANGVGYLFGPALWMTRDGGKTWRRITGPKTASLVIDGKTTYRIAFHHADCPTVCNPYVQAARTGSSSWRTIHRPVNFGYGSALTASGSRIFVTLFGAGPAGAPDAHVTYLESADGGASWVRRSDACGGQGLSERDTGVVEVEHHRTALSCERRHSPSRSTLLQSGDDGLTYGSPRRVPFPPAAIARVGRTLLIGSVALTAHHGYEYVVAASRDGGRTWHDVLRHRSSSSGLDNQTAILECVRRQCAYLADPWHVFISHDSGRTWITRGI
jgi:photosystem II stability/assembly factor-like uncharacterized protein